MRSHRQETNAAGLKYRYTYNIGERNWTIFFAPTVGYLSAYRSWDVWTVLAGGLLFTSLVGALIISVVGRSAELATANDRLQKEIVEKTQGEAKVRENNENFRALVNSAPDALLADQRFGYGQQRAAISNYRAQAG